MSNKTFDDIYDANKQYLISKKEDAKNFFIRERDALSSIFKYERKGTALCFCLYIALIIVVLALVITSMVYTSQIKTSNISQEVSNLKQTNDALTKKIINQTNDASSQSNTKEGMSPAQRLHLAHAYSKIGTDYGNKNKYDTALKNPTNGRRIKGSIKLYDNVEKAGNFTNVARGGMPMNYEKKAMQGKSNNMQALDNATLNGNYGPDSDPIGGKSDIVRVGNMTRMAGAKQDLSPFLGITSAKH